jgi:hypothetical protein
MGAGRHHGSQPCREHAQAAELSEEILKLENEHEAQARARMALYAVELANLVLAMDEWTTQSWSRR